jgi:crotonobetainyl-CoA:carnitine CoA-transferase CaiB-like acyl-CoA transferase
VVRAGGEDRWLAVAAPDETAAQALATVTGGLDIHALAEWAAPRMPQDAAATLQAAGVPAAPILAPHMLTYDPQLAAGGYWLEMERAFVGTHLVGASPFRFDGKRPALRLPAPLLGEHSAEVLAELA